MVKCCGVVLMNVVMLFDVIEMLMLCCKCCVELCCGCVDDDVGDVMDDVNELMVVVVCVVWMTL